jgi:hypothetical protein
VRTLARVAVAIPLVVVALFWVGALYFAGPRPQSLSTALALGYLLGTVAIFVFMRPFRRAVVLYGAVFVGLLAWWSTLLPSNEKDWAPEVARLPWAEIAGDRLVVHDLRNFDYRSETDWTPRYEEREYDLSKLVGVDLFMSYWGSPAIAHTIMSWQFEDMPPLAVSIETRKDKTQQYSAVQGFFKQYTIFYVVADERDLVRLRTNYRGEDVYLYRIRMPPEQAKAILLDYFETINDLRERPRWYNALTQNCTTTIRMHVQHIGGMQPFDWRLVVNGYGDQMLYERGRIDTSLPFAELRARSNVVARAKAADQDPEFWRRIREGLPDPRAPTPPGMPPAR